MEEAILAYHPPIFEHYQYPENRPIDMACKEAHGYGLTFRSAGFGGIEVLKQMTIFASTDVVQWLRRIGQLGWPGLLYKIGDHMSRKLKDAVSNDLQAYKNADGLCFKELAFCVGGSK